MQTDEELMSRFRAGDREAFELLFERHHRKVIRFTARMTGDLGRAEEAAQEVFLRIARAAPTWEPTARFTTWLYTIARRTTLNILRDGKDDGDTVPLPTGEHDDDGGPSLQLPGPAGLEPEQVVWNLQLRERLEVALGRLPEGYRSAFVLAAAEGLSYQEVAEVLGITVQAVKSRVFRAREMLIGQFDGMRP
jgi:RNA polymerase sigma-70 factor (ECF subfamily)